MFPSQIRLENTNACNGRCVICPREQMTRPQGFIADELLASLLEQCRGRGVRTFTVQGYGEPLLDPRFCRHLRRIKETLGCHTFSVSNGALITPELAQELVICGLDKIKISFYGLNRAEYERVHVPLRYDRTLAGIEALIRARRRCRSRLRIRLQYIGPFWRFIPFALRWLPRVQVGYNTLHNYGGGRAYRRPRATSRGCPMLDTPILQVLWTGQVLPCCYDFNGTMVLGDLRRDTIEAVWNGEPFRRIRDAHRHGNLSAYPMCQACDRRR
jgi:hypothetical protein